MTAKGERQVVEIPFYATHRIVSLLSFSRDSLGYKPDRTMLKTIFDRLVIFRENASSPFVSKIVRYHPDRPYLEKYNYDVSHLHLYGLEDYTGYLEYLTPTGSRTGIVRVVDGRPVRRHAVPNSQVLARRVSSKGMTTMSGGEWVCNDVCEPAYGTICIGGTGDPDYPGDETCYDDVIGENCYPDCEWVENPEEPVEPDFCDLPENWEICYGGGELEVPTVIINIEGEKVDPEEETKCFDKTQSAKLTVYVQQAKEGTRNDVGPNSVRHVFIGIEQGNVSRYLGYYPPSSASSVGIALGSDYNAEIRDNSGTMYHVSISKNITASQLSSIIHYTNNFPSTYNLNTYNCTDFGINVGNLGGLNLPSTSATGTMFTGRSPGHLGEDIRAMTVPPGVSKTGSKTNAPNKSGDCSN